MRATLTNVFGETAGAALHELVHTLRHAAAIASENPGKLVELVDGLSAIEGAAGNLRGVLFELIAAHLAKINAVSVDVGIYATDPATGSTADIDVLQVKSKGECCCIECKGKSPGGKVTGDEVDKWLKRIPTFRAHLRAQNPFREARLTFALWTTGEFTRWAKRQRIPERSVRGCWRRGCPTRRELRGIRAATAGYGPCPRRASRRRRAAELAKRAEADSTVTVRRARYSVDGADHNFRFASVEGLGGQQGQALRRPAVGPSGEVEAVEHGEAERSSRTSRS